VFILVKKYFKIWKCELVLFKMWKLKTVIFLMLLGLEVEISW
jgi:hypothetical protein